MLLVRYYAQNTATGNRRFLRQTQQPDIRAAVEFVPRLVKHKPLKSNEKVKVKVIPETRFNLAVVFRLGLWESTQVGFTGTNDDD